MRRFGFKKYQIISWLFFVIIFITHQLLLYFQIHIPLLDNYVDVFLFPLIVLPLILLERRFILSKKHFTIPINLLLFYGLLFVIISEWIFPILHQGFTKDYLDILMILIGVFIYHLLFGKS